MPLDVAASRRHQVVVLAGILGAPAVRRYSSRSLLCSAMGWPATENRRWWARLSAGRCPGIHQRVQALVAVAPGSGIAEGDAR